MSIQEKNQHMSKENLECNNLHSSQKAIVLQFAETEPMTINQLNKSISKDYKATYTTFKSLRRKKLIAETGSRNYNGQEYPCFWLTDEGMIMALMEGADADKLLQQTKKIYPTAEVTHCFLEIIPLFDPEIMRMAYSYAKGKGKLEFADVAQVVLSGAAAMDIETGKKIAIILKKYPKYYAALKMVVQQMIDQLNQLIID
jgi:hypothetical protein